MPDGGPSSESHGGWAYRLASSDELRALSSRRRAVVYLTVEWAVQERRSRVCFGELVEAVAGSYPHLGASFWILGEECEGGPEWLQKLGLDGSQVRGCGTVFWLDEGKVTASVSDAASIGSARLVNLTLTLWDY